MTTSAKTPTARRAQCAAWRQDLGRELLGLDDAQLREIGTWRDAVPATTAALLASRGCRLRG